MYMHFRNSMNLQFLSLAYCHNFTDKGLSMLAKSHGALKLAYLDLSGCMQVGNKS